MSIRLIKLLVGLSFAVFLSGCAADPVWAPDADIERVTYRHNGPPKLTLFTMVNVRSGAGAHTSMMINASQRVIWDPSGSFAHETIPERNDVLFGANPRMVDFYTRYHARETFYVIVQEVEVPAATAEKALQLAMANGAVGNAFCAHSTAGILRQLPGFGSIPQQMYPNKLSAAFGKIPGVTSRTLREDDSDDNSHVLRDYDPTTGTLN
ncbi:hypothetical protein KO498_08610 [Lentibacter algarum]|uniref:hypothetical protein n=1 Tax=Lentibacter algarum TaxID=576131 RepID=UPI001C07B2CF|nr:hypothetical protein [Lentibacter algarum]MBU2981875.1 hypothetical protein [Lentibacter algarum]